MERGEVLSISFGGWYQRTTIHLSEIYDFMSKSETKLKLSKQKISDYQKNLNLLFVKREFGNFERINAETKEGIKITYTEDGLYVLEKESDNIESAVKMLEGYYEKNFAPAINYIFSLGAPTPKILSNIKDQHPVVVKIIKSKHDEYLVDEKFGEVYSKISHDNMTVYKTKEFIFIVMPTRGNDLNSLTEMQIFFREFKQQLWKYINIHRNVWEEIDEILNNGNIKGKDVYSCIEKLRSYKRTLGLISNRINQMGTYAKTRASISKNLGTEDALMVLFQYHFEDLSNTLDYVKELWAATIDYVNSSISTLEQISNQAHKTNLESIKIIASVGVIALLINYLGAKAYPEITKIGIISLVIFGILATIAEFAMRAWANNKRYTIQFAELHKKL